MKTKHETKLLELQELIVQIKLALQLKGFARGLDRIINSEQFLVLPRRDEVKCAVTNASVAAFNINEVLSVSQILRVRSLTLPRKIADAFPLFPTLSSVAGIYTSHSGRQENMSSLTGGAVPTRLIIPSLMRIKYIML